MANFYSANLARSWFFTTEMRSANFTSANLYDARMRSAKLTGATLRNANLTSATLEAADLSKAEMTNANLDDANLDGANLVTAFTTSLGALTNVGPGLDMVGPMGNFSFYSGPTKLFLSLMMVVGRLEIFPILLLLQPSTWRR